MGTSVVKAEVLSLCEQLELSVRPGASSFGISFCFILCQANC